jgi:ABC-2 type transport system ATP-binding protein
MDETGNAGLRFKARTRLDTALLTAALPEGYAVRESAPGTYVVAGSVDPQVVSTVTAWCAQQGVLPEELQVGRRTLEEVFLELTGRELRA